MESFNCIYCGSSKIKLAKTIFESETEAKYQNQSDLTKSPNIKEILKPDSNVIVTSQSTLAKKLANFELKNQEKWKDFIDLENYNNKRKIKEKNRKYLAINKNKLLRMYKVIALLTFLFIVLHLIIIHFFVNIFLVLNAFISIFLSILFFYYYLILKNQKQQKGTLLFKIRKLEQTIKSKSKIIKQVLDGVETLVRHFLNVGKMSEQMKTPNPRQFMKEIEKIEKEGKKQLKKFNEERLKIWLNLYYCYDCDHVMDLEKDFYHKSEFINDLVNQLQTN